METLLTCAISLQTSVQLACKFRGNTWTVTDKRGNTYKFGLNATARQDDPSDANKVYKWWLEEVRDTNNNYIKYEYYKANQQIYPSKIFYTGYNTTDGIFEIEFTRESRNDQATSSVSAFMAVTKDRLNLIKAKINGTTVRQYDLEYTTSPNNLRSLLTSIIETGWDESGVSTTTPATQFSYHTTTRNWTHDANWTIPYTFADQSGDQGVRVVDVNGDALPDMIKSNELSGSSTKAVYINTGTNWAASSSWSIPEFITKDYNDQGVQFTDVNGDGYIDLLKAFDVGGSTTKQTYLNTGSGWTATSSYSIPVAFHTAATVGAVSIDNGVRITDVNGDGLPDFVEARKDGAGTTTRLYFNNGYGWTEKIGWAVPEVVIDSGIDMGTQFIDINGDGLSDTLRSYKTGPGQQPTNKVYLNSGSAWTLEPNWTNPATFSSGGGDQGVRLVDINGDGLPDVVKSQYWQSSNNSHTYLSNGVNAWVEDVNWLAPEYITDTYTQKSVQFADVDGDGMQDLIKSEDHGGGTVTKKVYINNGQPTDIMKRITYSKGGSTDITYQTTPRYTSGGTLSNPTLPFVVNTAKSFTNHDSLALFATTTYSYQGGSFYFNNPFDRKFAGFATISETSPIGNITKTFYHQGNVSDTTHGEYADHVAKIGQPYRSEIYNESSNLFAKSIYQWDRYAVDTKRSFIKFVRSLDFAYDGDSDHKETATEFTYDNTKGDVVSRIQWGEVTGSDDGNFTDTGNDKSSTSYAYAASSTNATMSLLKDEVILDQSGGKVKQNRYYYDTLALGSATKGNLTKTETWATSSTYINAQSSFNTYGLRTQDLDPRGNATNYVYDAYNMYPATTTNALSQSIKYTYDYTSGKVKSMTDMNGFVHESIFDGLDRLLEVKEPRGTNGALVTVEQNIYTDTTGSVSVQNKKYLDSTNVVDSYLYLDGLGRVIQSRQEAETSNQFSVRDTVYRSDGNVAKESLPYFSTGGARTTATTQNNLYTRYTYDALNRKVGSNTVLGTTTMSYDQWQETVTDTLGNIKKINYDAYGNIASVIEQNGTSTYTTTYTWTPHNQLAKITDALGNVRSAQYDGLGRRLSMEDLHATTDTTFGKWLFSYDAAGNLATTTDPKAQVMVTTYDALNRPLTENFTGQAGIEASYTYDTCTNGKGYLCTTISTAATTTRTYNPAGVVATEQKTIGTTAYSHSYLFDRQNNQTQLTYPDNSDVKYSFNTAGLLEKVEQRESGGAYRDIITNYNYSPTGQITYQLHGNGASTTRVYDENELYRLRSVVTSATNPTGGGGELALLEGELPLMFEDTTIILPEEATIDTGSALPEFVEPIVESLFEEAALGTSTPAEVIEVPAAEEIIIQESVAMSEEKIKYIDFITNSKEADVWRRYHQERLAYLKTLKGADAEMIKAAESAKAKYDTYLVDEGYIESAEEEINTVGFEIVHFITSTLKGLAQAVLPEKAYAYLFDKEDFETCGTLPCTLDGNLSWGSVALSLDSTSMVAGTDSLKTVVTGAGGGSLETTDYNTTEIWSQFKVYIPSGFTWGTSGFFTAFKIEDPSNGTLMWMSVENYGTPRLTVMGDVLGYTDTGLNLVTGAVNTIEIRVKTGNGTGDVDIWLNSSTQGSPSYNGSGSMNLGTDNIDDILFGMHYAPESGLSTTYYDELIVNNAFIGASTSSSTNAAPTAPTSLQTEDQTNPTGVTDSTPEFSALYNDPNAGDVANKFRLQVSTSSSFASIYFDTSTTTMASTTAGNRNANVSYSGSPLASSTTYYWRIKFFDDENAEGAWSTTTATFSLASGSGGGSSTTTQLIYGDSLVAGWDNWSYGGTYNTSGTGQVYSGTYAFESSITSQYGGIQLRNASLNTTGYTTLNFSFYLSSGSGVNIQMRGVNKDTSTDLGYANLSSYLPGGTYTSGSWYQVTVPLADLGLTNFVGNGAIILQSNGSPTVVTYFDNMQFVGTTTPNPAASFVPLVQHLTYTYDSVGNITQIIDRSGTRGAATTTYTYDTLYRLTSASTTLASSTPYKETYAYNAIGNITSKSNVGNYTYAGNTGSSYANPHAATTINGVTYTYDLNGNLASTSASQTNTWDYRNRLTTATKSGTNTTYLYDINEQRVQKTVGGKTTRYPSPYFETTNASTTKHVYANGTLVSTVDGTGSASTTVYHNHQDHLGSTAVVTNAIGYLSRLYNYYPYGALRLDEGSGAFTQLNQFIGQDRDTEADLSYLNARYYSANQGQFISQDPVFWEVGITNDGISVLINPQLQNSYSYAANNPIIQKDPSGRIPPLIGVIFVALEVYSYANTAVDLYNYSNVLRYREGYSSAEKDDARNRVIKDVFSFGIGRIGGDVANAGMNTVDAVHDTASYVSGKANIIPMERSININQTTPALPANVSTNITSSTKVNKQTYISAPSSNRTSVNSSSYKSASEYLNSAQKALNRGDLNGAANYIEKAKKSLNKK